MLPYSREVLFSLFAELNRGFAVAQALAFLLVLLIAWMLLGSPRRKVALPLVLLGCLWLGCAYFWLWRIVGGINFLGPLYAGLAALQGILLLGISAAAIPREHSRKRKSVAATLIALALLWPLVDIATASGWPHVRLPGLHLVPLLWLTLGALSLRPIRYTALLGAIPMLLTASILYQAYVLGIWQDFSLAAAWITLLALLYGDARAGTQA